MLNHIVIMGRLTRDPELRRTNSGKPVASFTVAVDRDFSGQDGQKETDFIDCVAWQGTAEFVSKYFKKGSMAVVSGRLQLRDWTDKDGNKRRSAEVLANNVYFGESKRDSQQSYGYPQGAQQPQNGGFQGQVYQPPQSYNGAGGQQGYHQQGFGGYQQQNQYSPPYNPGGFQQIDGPDEQLPF